MIEPIELWLPEKDRLPEHLANILDFTSIQPCYHQPESPYFLQYQNDTVRLMKQGHKNSVWVDFTQGKIAHRTQFKGKELLLKAVNIRENKTIWDITAGLGYDSYLLAHSGATVELFERHPIALFLLANGLHRASTHPAIAPIIERMKLHAGSYQHHINRLPESEKPPVIYLDPMFPERKKTAAVNQAMQYFQAAIGEDTDAANTLAEARTIAQKRIVLKRPQWAKPLIEDPCAYSYQGKNTRFDVYLPL